MIGYIIKNKDDSTLTKNFSWIPRDENEGLGFVHTINVLEYIRVSSFDWEIKPYSYQMAEFNEQTNEVKYISNQIYYF